MHRTLARSAVAALSLAVAVPAAVAPAAPQPRGPDRSDEVRRALASLPVAPGTWEGTAWYRQGPGVPDTIRQTERVETRLDGTVILLDGIGRENGEVVHHAFATLGWDPARDVYRMTTWLADGTLTEAETSFEDGVFTWGFDVPGGPLVRFRISAPSDGVWHEEGEISPDGGATWHDFFGMTLHRTGPVEEGR